MSVTFTEEDKAVREFSERFGFGVHEVQIGFIEIGQTDSGTDYIEFDVLGVGDEEGIEDKARLWFTGGATNISFGVAQQLYVHNAPDSKKDEARASVQAVKDLDELVALLQAKIVGGQAWLTIYQDPKRTYTNPQGVTKPSINKNILGYEPKPRNDLLTPATTADDLVGTDDEATKKFFANATPASADDVNGIPKSW